MRIFLNQMCADLRKEGTTPLGAWSESFWWDVVGLLPTMAAHRDRLARFRSQVCCKPCEETVALNVGSELIRAMAAAFNDDLEGLTTAEKVNENVLQHVRNAAMFDDRFLLPEEP